MSRTLPALLCGALLLAGCASMPRPEGPALELAAVPFYAGDDGLCGPAALATVLRAAGVRTSPTALAGELLLPGRGGTLQAEMLAGIRRSDRLPVVLEPDFTALLAALRAGHPVLVLQNLGIGWWPSWHYAVVVGYLPASDTLVLRSGSQPRRLTGRRLFLRTWRRADGWAAMALPPGALPEFVSRQAYRQAVVSLESAGRLAAAEHAYRAGLKRWPADGILKLGLANVLSAQGRHGAATAAYGEAFELRPGDPIVANNFAMSLSRLGCMQEALALLDRTLSALPMDSRWRGALQASVAEIEATTPQGDPRDCAEP